MQLPKLRLKKNEERRIRAGHLWIYSNEIDTQANPLKSFNTGDEVLVETYDKKPLGIAYVNPHSLITARLLSRDPKDRFDQAFIAKRIKIALAGREKLFSKPFYRLVFGESDGLPGLIVDRFGEHLVVQLNTVGMDAKKEIVLKGLLEVFPDIKSILFRNDSSARTQENLSAEVIQAYGETPENLIIEENNTQFNALPKTGQKTGWFYDHRLNRSRLKDYVEGKRVLDVFSYLGGWGIQSANFGAREVVCLDVSELATQAIMSNAELNNVANKVSVICDDAFVGLKNLLQQGQKFDVIVLDPPAFIKKQKDKKEGLIAYQRINEAALKLLNNEGILFSCSCSMHLEFDDLIQAIRRAGINTNCELQILERGHQAQDHPVHLAIPETDYIKMVIARKV